MKAKENITIVIMGASGDLCRRKLMPSLFQLYRNGYLPENFKIIGYARTAYSSKEYHQQLLKLYDYVDAESFLSHVEYVQGDYDREEDFQGLGRVLENWLSNRIFYLAIPPELVRGICSCLKSTGLVSKCANKHDLDSPYCSHSSYWARIVVEKPYGRDLDSAKDLDDFLHGLFNERQLYRIDHYLGKETVQNILAFRFANSLFEPVWNSNYIERIELNISEELGIEERAAYFDHTGIARDLVQNHALQLLSLVTMEPPISFDAKSIRDEKVKVLSSLRPFLPEEVATSTLRAQYLGYRETRGVKEGSITETFVALRFLINNWRWSSTPVYIRAGKGLDQKTTEVHIHFKNPPHNLFQYRSHYSQSNVVMFRIQPQEGIHLLVQSKVPGHEYELVPVEMDFSYNDNFKIRLQDAYERLLLDVMNDDASLFIRNDEVEASWKFVDSFLKEWEVQRDIPLYSYNQGEIGPREMHSYIHNWGHRWSKDICRLKI